MTPSGILYGRVRSENLQHHMTYKQEDIVLVNKVNLFPLILRHCPDFVEEASLLSPQVNIVFSVAAMLLPIHESVLVSETATLTHRGEVFRLLHLYIAPCKTNSY